MAYIIVSNDDGEIARRELKRSLIIGRSSKCDICLKDKQISRHHCRIAPLEDTWLVEDLGSHNGTCVNGHETKRHMLADGDRVEVGETLIEFHTAPFPSSRPTSPHEARVHAELLREVDSLNSSEETMTGALRPLPRVKLDPPKPAAPTDADVQHGSAAAFARPKPAPKINNPATPAKPPPRPSLLDRLLRRKPPG